MSSSSDEGGHECEICHKSFAEKRYLTKHVKRVHPDGQIKKKKDNSMQCPICQKTFPRYSHLSRHQLSCMNIRSFECPYCEDKFQQKPHLIRHIGRKHPHEGREKVDEVLESAENKKTRANKISKPSTSQSALCKDLIERHLCIKCGHIFTERHDLMKHSTHHPLVCHHCNVIFYGNTALKKHELMTRTARYTCSCGASFSTIRILKNHENACRRRGEFMCIQNECKQLFCQRVQLDRHWNKVHFITKNCTFCSFVAEAPLKLAHHVEQEHQKKICGFCGEQDPDEKHISTLHWRRLKKALALERKARRSQEVKEEPTVKEEEGTEENEEYLSISTSPDNNWCTSENEEMEDVTEANEIHESNELEPSRFNSPIPGPTSSASGYEERYEDNGLSPMPSYEISDEIPNSLGGVPDLNFLTDSTIPSVSFSSTDPDHDSIINLVIQIPHQCTRLILSDHLTNELALTFPELLNTRVVISEDFQGRLLSLFVPVSSRGGPDSQKWINEPIYL